MTTKHKIINIQFLRAFAAIVVVFYHTSAHFFVTGGERSGNIFSFMSQIGYAGVDIFFVISGYIMWITTQHKQGIQSVKKFIYSRITRIYPLYWSFLFLLSLMYMYKLSFEHIDIIDSIFLTVSSTKSLLLQVAWTLQYELYFYFLFSLLLFIPIKFRIHLLILVFITIIGVQSYAILSLNIYAELHFNTASSFYTFWFSPYILEFILGTFVGYFFDNFKIKKWLLLLIPIILLPTVAMLYQNTITHLLDSSYFLPQRVFLFGLFSTFLLAFLVELNHRNIILFPKLSLLVGNASYSLYLSHTILLLAIYGVGLRNAIQHYGKYQEFFMILIIIGMVLYSILHYRYIEQPLIRFFKRLIQ